MFSVTLLCAGSCGVSTVESLPLTVLSRFPAVTVFVHRLSVALGGVEDRHGMVGH